MDIIYKLILVLHFIGVAMLVGGFFSQMGAKPPLITHWMRDGVLLQLITGFALVGIAPNLDPSQTFDNAAVGTKLLIAVVVTGLVLFGMRQDPEKQKPYWAAAGALAIINILVAVFWVSA